ncbi:MAG: CehA/McbA family metallohydrolase [Phenylobacterium sp.]|nr:CehA/McbA family metallohydrolase [Phenylobacterium sp.]
MAWATAMLWGLAAGGAGAETLTLRGVMTGADHQTYREVPFHVPAGTTAVTVAFDYTGQDQKAVIDLGLRDPARFRGWSGGNKARFTLTETWATPSYLPGPLPAGEWRLILGAPNLRPGTTAAYTATVTLDDSPVFRGFAEAPLKAGPGWYRGDLHLHTGHSDGQCVAQSGGRAPCPLALTLEAAAARGLDFVALTEHNATSHHQALAEAQPHFDRLLLIPGREITTFQGHLNVFGVTAPLDFQLGGPRAPDVGTILDQVAQAQGLAPINHPGLPSGEVCMGCGWTAPVDFARVGLVEAVNGAFAEGPLSGLPFWEARLNEGRRVTGISGSDNHDPRLAPDKAGAVGRPTTVVQADNLSQGAILDGLRAGRAFIDVQGSGTRLLEITARQGGRSVGMGGALPPRPGDVAITVRVVDAVGGRLEFRGDPGLGIPPTMPIETADQTLALTVAADGRPHWLRADVRGPDGRLWLIGNPVYLGY